MRYLLALCMLTLFSTACSDDPISITVNPAQYSDDAQAPPPDGWQQVKFAGSPRGRAGAYLVRQEPLFTEFNIIEFRGAGQAIAVRLNAYSLKKLGEFAADPTNLKKPLAVNINGRWADFMPLLEAPKDRMILYGFTEEEKVQLRRYIDNK